MTSATISALGDVCQINPRPPRGSLPTRDTPVSFVAMADVDENRGEIVNRQQRLISEVERGYTPFEEGDVLFAKITPCMENGKAAIARDLVNGRGFGSTEFYVIRPSGRILAEYIYYFVRQNSFRALCKANFSGSVGQQRVPRDFLSRFQLPVPALDEQRRIVDILGHASSIRRLREQAQAKAREIIPALFLDMFGDPATNPLGWEAGIVGDILTSAQYGTSTKASEIDVGTPMLRMGNVTTDGELSLNDLKYVVLEDDEVEKYALRAGDILFNRTNSKELVGKTGLWDGRFSAVHASYFIRLRVDPTHAKPAYVWAFFNSAFMKRRLFETARGAIGQSNINAKEVRAFPIPIPSMRLQEKFTEYLEDVQALVSVGKEARASADAASQSLLHRCFNSTESQ